MNSIDSKLYLHNNIGPSVFRLTSKGKVVIDSKFPFIEKT